MATHFDAEALKFLRGLAKHNDREWFEPRRPIYERALKTPMTALVEEINHAMEAFAPEHVRPAPKVMMRIYRDTRFSKDKRPYKRNFGAWWARRGMEKTSGGGYYLHIGPDEVMISAGVYMPERDQLLAIRRHLAERHEDYRKLYGKLLRSKALGWSAIDGAPLSRTPKGFEKDGPADDLLRARNWGVHAILPASAAESPNLLRDVVQRFKAAAPLVELLNEPLVAGPGHAQKRSAFDF